MTESISSWISLALGYAVKAGNVQLVKLLLEHPNYDPSRWDGNELISALEGDNEAIIDLLVQDKRVWPTSKPGLEQLKKLLEKKGGDKLHWTDEPEFVLPDSNYEFPEEKLDEIPVKNIKENQEKKFNPSADMDGMLGYLLIERRIISKIWRCSSNY